MNGQKLLFLCGVVMAGFLDLAIGTLIATVVGSVMGMPMNVWNLIIGGFIALAPDIVEMVKSHLKGKNPLANGHHESWDHWPVSMMFYGVALGLVFGGWYWGSVSFLCLLFHYTHDMEFWGSGGIPFFAPIDLRYFAWWRGFYDPQTSVMYKPETELDPWIQRNWLRPSWMSVREMTFGSLALALSSSMILGFKVGFFLFAFCWIGTVLVWHETKN